MHPYYDTMLHNWNAIRLTFIGLITALIPTTYLMFVKKKSFWGVLSMVFL
jgi:hypothetical protein